MKKTGIWMFVVMFVFSMILAGCGGGASNSGSGTNTGTDTGANPGQPSGSPQGEPLKLVVGHTGTPGNSVYVFFEKLKEEVESRSNGAIQLEIHHSGVLGGDNQLVESLQIGSIDITSAASSNMASFTKSLLALDLPYLFKSREGANKVLNGEIGERLLKETSEAAGTHALTFIDVGGFRLLANTKKEVRVPDDAKGLKLRATASPIEIALIQAMGANPSPIAWGETYSSLEQKVVDGLQLQANWLALNGFGEIVDYATKTQGLMAFHVVQFNKQKWDSMTDEQRKIFEEALNSTRDLANKTDAEDEEKFLKDLESQGVKIYDPTPEELEQWRALGQKVREAQLAENKDLDGNLVEEIIRAQQ